MVEDRVQISPIQQIENHDIRTKEINVKHNIITFILDIYIYIYT